MALAQKSLEVFLAEGPISEVGAREIDTLKAAVKASPKKRARINAHPDGEDALHEMIIAIDASCPTSVPHKHPTKSEAFHIVEGEVDIVVFTEGGEIDRIISLGAPGSGRAFYYRMSKPFFHTLIIRSGVLVVHEITNGPFRPDGTILLGFAPSKIPTSPKPAAWQAELVAARRRIAGTRGSEERNTRRWSSAAPRGSAVSSRTISWRGDARSASYHDASPPILRRPAAPPFRGRSGET